MKEKRLKTAAECLLPGLITLVVFSSVLVFKGIFPFGSNLIDYYDMGQTNAPLYYHIWDFLHGKSACFFDWYINLSQNLAMGSSIQWNISPFNLYFLFIPRELAYRSLSVYMGLHLFFMAFFMGVFLRSVFPDIRRHFLVTGAIAYGLCGFTLTHYTIPTYLDTAAFLPLFAAALMRLLQGKGKAMYTLMLGFMTALSYYLGFMQLIYVLLFSGIYILLMTEDRAVKKRRAADLAAGTAGGLLLSSFMLVPSVMEMTLSSRFNSNLSDGPAATLVSILNSIGADEYYVKFLQLYGMELFIIIIAAGAFRYRKERRYTATLLMTALIPCALVFFESINILWHFGTYYHYPIRCGYLIPFSLISAAAGFYRRMAEYRAVPVKAEILSVVLSAAAVAALLSYYFQHETWEVTVLFRYWLIISGVILAITVVILLVYKSITGVVYLAVPVVMAELVVGAVAGYGMPHFKDSFFGDPEQSGEYILKAEAFREAADGLSDLEDTDCRICRIKNPDTELNTNYGMVIRRGTVTGWANTATREIQTTAEKLGYSTHFMRILDSGGTFLTDSVLQIKDLIDCAGTVEETDGVLEKTGEYHTGCGDFAVFHNEAGFPFAMAADGSIDDWSFEDNSIAENNNELYKALSGDSENIAGVIKISDIAGENITSDIVSTDINVSGRQALYLSRGRADSIRIDGKTVPVPTIGDMANKEYPAWFNSNLLYLGTRENGKVSLECPVKSRIITIDINKLTALSRKLYSEAEGSGSGVPVTGRNDLRYCVYGEGGRNRALIPLSYSPGWSAAVNGKEAEIKDLGGMFMTVPINEGPNEIELKFRTPGLIPGICISLLTLLAVILLLLHKGAATAGEKLLGYADSVIYGIFLAVFSAAGLALYVIPVCWTVIHIVIKRFI